MLRINSLLCFYDVTIFCSYFFVCAEFRTGQKWPAPSDSESDKGQLD